MNALEVSIQVGRMTSLEPGPAGIFYHRSTPGVVRREIDSAYLHSLRRRLFYGDTETGEAWPQENDVLGRVERSMGPLKIPLLTHNRRSTSGEPILDHCIVAIMSTPFVFLYRHPGFDVGDWDVGPGRSPGFSEAAFHNGELHAQFKKAGAAKRYCAFMRGDRFSK